MYKKILPCLLLFFFLSMFAFRFSFCSFYNMISMYFGFSTLVLSWKDDSICIFKLYKWSIMYFSTLRMHTGGMSLGMRMYFTLGLCHSLQFHCVYFYFRWVWSRSYLNISGNINFITIKLKKILWCFSYNSISSKSFPLSHIGLWRCSDI